MENHQSWKTTEAALAQFWESKNISELYLTIGTCILSYDDTFSSDASYVFFLQCLLPSYHHELLKTAIYVTDSVLKIPSIIQEPYFYLYNFFTQVPLLMNFEQFQDTLRNFNIIEMNIE